MATNVSENNISSMAEDWGSDSTNGLPYSGEAVQKFIKEQLNSKYAVIRISEEINEQNFYSLEMFATKEDEELYDGDPETYANLIATVPIPISTVQGDSYAAYLSTSIDTSANIVSVEDKLNIPLNFRGVRISILDKTNVGARGTLTIQRSADGGTTWSTVGTIANALTSHDYEDAATYEEIDIKPYIQSGKQLIRVRASFEYEDESGTTKTSTSSWAMIGASITVTTLSVSLLRNYSTPIDASGSNPSFPLSSMFSITGSVAKTLHVQITGSVGTKTIELSLTAAQTGNNTGLSDQSEDASCGILTHGVKRVTAWLTCDSGMGTTLTSNKLVSRFMVVNPNTAGADLTKPYILIQNLQTEVTNYVQTTLCDYAVYSPLVADDGTVTNNGEAINVAFLLTDYSEDYENAEVAEYLRMEYEVSPGTKNSLVSTVEIEGDEKDKYSAYFRVRRIDGDTSTDFMKESTGETNYSVSVDNSLSFAPVSGATFLINPKVRNNSESDPARILNALDDNTEVESEWSGFGFVNDGWITAEDGQKVLRVPAGATLKIKRNPFAKFMAIPDSSMTIDIDFKVRNVTNESDPIIDISDATSSGGFRGLRMNALDGWVMTTSYTEKNNCLFSWREDKRTYVSLNINSNVETNKGDVRTTLSASDYSSKTALARIMVSGSPDREIPFNAINPATKTVGGVDYYVEWTSDTFEGIVIGNEGADIDIYSIRIYEGDNAANIELTDLLNKNYVASMPTAEEKVKLRERNDILGENGLISYEKVYALGINCMIWHGDTPYNSSQSDTKGWREYFRFDENGNYLPEYSGTNCKATKSLKQKGQGTTAKTYYDWNEQEDNSKVTDTIQVLLEDFHDSITISEPYEGSDGLMYVDVKGGNLGKNFPVEEVTQSYVYSDGYVTVPDGWIDGNGKYRGMGYMVAEGCALAQKNVNKINYASSMQSHLLGACKTYDLLHRAVVGNTPLQDKVPTAVSAKHTEPFMCFRQTTDGGDIIYTGLGTYGAGKMDKVAWGYAKKLQPYFALIEGSDNNGYMTGFRVPFDKKTAVYSPEGEGWLYNGVQSFDFDAGATYDTTAEDPDGWKYADEGEIPKETIRNEWAKKHNFIYLHAPNIKYYVGTFAAFKVDAAYNTDFNYKYWCTGDGDYRLYRYDHINNEWIDAGLLDESTGEYRAVYLNTDPMTKAVFDATDDKAQYAALTKAFNEAVVAHFKKYAKYFIKVESLQFNYAYVLGFLAGTDNSDKNTYYKIMPYPETEAKDDDFTAWCAEVGIPFDYSAIYKLYFDGDDMDSIWKTDNNSHQTKPYYIDRQHPYSDDDPDTCLYEGMHNALFNLCEQAYEATGELRTTMNKMLTAATGLLDANTDVFFGDESSPTGVWAFLHKYFLNTQNYFPQMAYVEQARIRYEWPQAIGFISSGSGGRNIKPITQSLGSQLQSETQYMQRRLVYMASYAQFGELAGVTGASIGLSDASDKLGWMPSVTPSGGVADHVITVRPHQYIYPAGYLGSTNVYSGVRLSPSDTYEFTLATQQATSDTGIGLHGINYYSSIGNFGNMSIQAKEFIVVGKRLTEFIANPTVTYDGLAAFKPSSITVSAKQLKTFSLNGCTQIGQTLDLSSLTRCKEIDLQSTQIYNVTFPASSLLETVKLGASIAQFAIDDAPNLSTLTFGGYNALTSFSIGDNVGSLNSQIYVQGLYDAKVTNATSATVALSSLSLRNIEWTDLPIAVFMWVTDNVASASLTGTVGIYEPSTSTYSVLFDYKKRINLRWGNVDDVDSEDYAGLLLSYKMATVNENLSKISGNFYNDGSTEYQFVLTPYSAYSNAFTKISWYITEAASSTGEVYWTMNETTGVLTIHKLPTTATTATVTVVVATYYDGAVGELTFTKNIEIYDREAQLGDYVYYDGTYSSPDTYDGEKTVIGICCYIAPKDENGGIVDELANPNDKQQRLMVALNDVTAYSGNGSTYTFVPWGAFYVSDSTYAQNSLTYPEATTTENEDGTTTTTYVDKPVVDDSGVSIFDVTSVQNISSMGGTSPIATDTFRDETSTEGTQNAGFKPIAANTCLGDGFGYEEPTGYVSARTLTSDLAALTDNTYAEGDIVNSGYAKTLKIIAWRNAVLKAGLSCIGLPPNQPIPQASGNVSELTSLANLMDSLTTFGESQYEGVNPSRWRQLAWPAASMAYAYQPTVKSSEVLADRFKAHRWFLPTNGLLARLYWYTAKGDEDDAGKDIFAPAKNAGLLSLSSSYRWSSTELNSFVAWSVVFGSGYVTGYGKSNPCVVRAVAAF